MRAAGLIKFLAPQMQRLFKGGAYLKIDLMAFFLSVWKFSPFVSHFSIYTFPVTVVSLLNMNLIVPFNPV